MGTSIFTGFGLLVVAQASLGRTLPSDSLFFEASAVFLSLALVTSVLYVGSIRQNQGVPLFLLGAFWLLAAIALIVDYFVDNYYGKLLVVFLFLITGLRYWDGSRDAIVGFALSIITIGLIAGDGAGHLRGEHCVDTGLTSCPVKFISDMYLLLFLVPLCYATIKARTRRPNLLAIVATIVVMLSLAVGFGAG